MSMTPPEDVNRYSVGAGIRVDAAFHDRDGAAVDPATVVFKVLDSTGSEVEYVYGDDEEVVKESTGNYYLVFVVDRAGYWHYRVEGTGTNPNPAVKEGRVYVNPSKFS